MVDLLGDDGLLDLRHAKRSDLEEFARTLPPEAPTPVHGAAAPTPPAPTASAPGVPTASAPGVPTASAPTAPVPASSAAPTCHICKRQAKRTCRGCQKPVCAADSWTMFGLCTTCASEDRVARWNKKSQTSSNWLDR